MLQRGNVDCNFPRASNYEPEMEDEPLAIEYREAEAGTLPVPHLPPGPDTPAVMPVPMLYSDALCGSTQDLPDIEYYIKRKQPHSGQSIRRDVSG